MAKGKCKITFEDPYGYVYVAVGADAKWEAGRTRTSLVDQCGKCSIQLGEAANYLLAEIENADSVTFYAKGYNPDDSGARQRVIDAAVKFAKPWLQRPEKYGMACGAVVPRFDNGDTAIIASLLDLLKAVEEYR